MTTYLLAGGGTAGHVNPLLAVADALMERDPDSVVLVLGTAEGLEARLVPARGYELLTIDRVPMPRRPSGAALRFPARLGATVGAVSRILSDRSVDVVVGFGGYVSAPAYLAARRSHVPLVIHEANARPGLANRLGALFTPFVGTAFPGTPLRGAITVGMPLRREIAELDRFEGRRRGLAEFGLAADRPVLLVTGGSSGARRINATIAASIALIVGTGWQVLHLTGQLRDPIVDPGLPGYRLVAYTDRMDLALAVADLTIARAGTSTVSELSALGIPAVFVPYPVGNGEQRLNARFAVDVGGAVVVRDADFDEDWVGQELVPLLASRATIAEMAARMVAAGVSDGTEKTIALIDRAASGR